MAHFNETFINVEIPSLKVAELQLLIYGKSGRELNLQPKNVLLS